MVHQMINAGVGGYLGILVMGTYKGLFELWFFGVKDFGKDIFRV